MCFPNADTKINETDSVPQREQLMSTITEIVRLNEMIGDVQSVCQGNKKMRKKSQTQAQMRKPIASPSPSACTTNEARTHSREDAEQNFCFCFLKRGIANGGFLFRHTTSLRMQCKYRNTAAVSFVFCYSSSVAL